jgi:hypothetical protein
LGRWIRQTAPPLRYRDEVDARDRREYRLDQLRARTAPRGSLTRLRAMSVRSRTVRTTPRARGRASESVTP